MNIEFPLIGEAMRLFRESRDAAQADLENISDHALIGAQTRKQMAAREAEEVAFFIRGLIEQDSAAIFPLGPEAHQAKFAELAEDEGEAFVVPAQKLYETLAEGVMPYLDRGTFGISAAQAFAAAMSNVATRLRLGSYVFPHVGPYLGRPIADKAALVDLLRGLVRAANLDELNAAFITHLVFEKVMETEYDNNGVTVIVTGTTEEEAKGDLAQKLFGGHTVSVDVTAVPEKNDLVLIAKHIKPFFSRANGVFQKMSAHKARAAKAQKAATDAAPTQADEATDNPAAAS
jgi:hypothetical protein